MREKGSDTENKAEPSQRRIIQLASLRLAGSLIPWDLLNSLMKCFRERSVLGMK